MISKPRYSVRWVFFALLQSMTGWYKHRLFRPIRESKTVLYSGFHTVDSRFQVLNSGMFVSGTWIPDSNRLWDPDSSSCIPDSKAEYSWFYLQEFPVFRNPLHGTRGSTLVTSGFHPNNFNAYFRKMVYWFQRLIGKPTLGLLTWAELLKAVKITQGKCQIWIQTWKLKRQIQFNSFVHTLMTECSKNTREIYPRRCFETKENETWRIKN